MEQQKLSCEYCQGTVKDWVRCASCQRYFHPACMRRAAELKSAVCVHVAEDIQSEVMSGDTEVIKVLRELLRAKEQIIREQAETIKCNDQIITLLEEKCKMQRATIRDLEM